MFPKRRIPMKTPSSRDPAPASDAFTLLPVACLPSVPESVRLQQQALYEWAYQQAQAVLKPSILERDLLAVWN